MAYPGVFYATDGEILRAMQQARRTGATDHDARGERHRDRPAGRAGAGRGQDRAGAARPDPAAGAGSRGHLPGHRAGQGDRLAAVHGAPVRRAGAGCRRGGPRHRAERVRRDLPAVPVPVDGRPGPARSSRGPSTWPRRRCGPGSTRARCGAGCAPTTCRWCPPITARSASPSRRNSAGATSPRSRTGYPAWSTGWTCCIRAWRRRAVAGPLGRGGLHHAGPDVRAVSAQGHIQPGSDADIVIYDPRARQMLSAARTT